MAMKFASSLFLMSTGAWIGILIGAVIAVGVGLFFLGLFLQKKKTDKRLGEIDTVVRKMLDDARVESKAIKKEAILEAKEQELKLRNEFERESKEKRAEIQKLENRLVQKEEILDKKEDNLLKRNEEVTRQQQNLKNKEAEVDKKLEEIRGQHEQMLLQFEKISQMSRDEAKAELVAAMEDEAKKDAVGLVRQIESDAKEEADKKAKEIISLAIQKCSTEQATEITVSVVPLPNDDMKARIIGREEIGRAHV